MECSAQLIELSLQGDSVDVQLPGKSQAREVVDVLRQGLDLHALAAEILAADVGLTVPAHASGQGELFLDAFHTALLLALETHGAWPPSLPCPLCANPFGGIVKRGTILRSRSSWRRSGC